MSLLSIIKYYSSVCEANFTKPPHRYILLVGSEEYPHLHIFKQYAEQHHNGG